MYLFSRERGREEEKEGEKHQCVVASHMAPNWGPRPQPRHVPWLGIELMTLWFSACAQSTEPHQPGLDCFLKKKIIEVKLTYN